MVYQAELEENRRAAACLEFLNGIPTKLLERFISDSGEHRDGGPLAEVREHIMTWARNNRCIFGDADEWDPSKIWEDKQGETSMPTESDLPLRLDKVLDEIGPGAMIKHVESGARAMLVDFICHLDTLRSALIVAVVDWSTLDQNVSEEPNRLENYKLCVVEDYRDWIALTLGDSRELLIP